MHNSELNAPIDEISSLPTQFTTGPFLLRSSDRSGACLNCHGEGTDNHSYHVYTETADVDPALVPEQYGPGGDFAWLQVGTTGDKERRGHNIIASDFGLVADTGIATSPGGDYPAANLACSSCHDPHAKYRVLGGTTAQVTTGAPIVESGSYGGTDYVPLASLPTDEAKGVYRFLGGVGYESDGTVTPFGSPAPVALAPSTYNSTTAEGGVRVAYGSDMSEWCGNCHGSIHNDSYPTNLRHPAGNGAALGTVVADNYNAYVSSGINTNTADVSYLPLIPFETGDGYAADVALNDTVGSTAGPSSTNNVLCLSCHRAHASAFTSMLRWDYQASPFVVKESGEYNRPAGLTTEQVNAAYYNLPASTFGAFQRQLCNKCHAKD
jgi:predicted CXXCH cytochrome family protein